MARKHIFCVIRAAGVGRAFSCVCEFVRLFIHSSIHVKKEKFNVSVSVCRFVSAPKGNCLELKVDRDNSPWQS